MQYFHKKFLEKIFNFIDHGGNIGHIVMDLNRRISIYGIMKHLIEKELVDSWIYIIVPLLLLLANACT
jgi:hypothetical protein